MRKNLSIKSYVVCALLAVILLLACNPEKAYKVRRLHNGHARIAYSYGKRELPTPKATLLIPTKNTAAVDRIAEVHPEITVITTPITEAKTELVEANFTVLQADLCDRDPEFYNKVPPPTPRANPFEKYVAPEWNNITQGSESMWEYIFGDFWNVVLVILIVLAVISLIAVLVLYGTAIAAAIGAGTWLEVLFVLIFLALAVYIDSTM